ncbi:MAG: response regulator [Omnitrophica WOR_2 bacterium]
MSESILLVEDEPYLLKTTAEILKREGYAVTAVSSGEDANKTLLFSGFDLILMDLSMPGYRNLDLFNIIHSHYPFTPVLVFSGILYSDMIEQASLLGASGCIKKPIDPVQLVEAIRTTLNNQPVALLDNRVYASQVDG